MSASVDLHDSLFSLSRRAALGTIALTSAGFAAARSGLPQPAYHISLAQWSLHKMHFAGELNNLEFPAFTKSEFGISAVEFVNQFFKDKANDRAYLTELRTRASDAGVKCLLIMCDGEGNLGDPDDAARSSAVENHIKWLDAAAMLGCHSIRVNAASEGTFEQQQELAADGLRRLAGLGGERGINVLVENHGGFSSHGAWLAGVMKKVDHPRCGTLPDFGNFCMDWSRVDDPDAWYDRYLGVKELMPFARAVSAKSHEFNAQGDEVRTDFLRMMKIVRQAGYSGYVGIEFEGSGISEHAGVLKTKQLLERVRDQLAG